ncbi:AAA family ATPase [Thermofilum pendens]|uniref:AAA family ATPase n=1 Tax=Thermofilum pendens TaxID=2269 RepID=UPI0000DCF833|nr:SMC family ATPase [Thermofilum pendens]
MVVLLRRVEVEGYRFFKDPFRVEFGDGVTVIAGPVGSGKSSLLSAVEYALYGTDSYIERRVYTKKDLVNSASASLRVLLELEVEGEGVYRIERRLSKEGRERVEVLLPDGGILRESSKVLEKVEELLGMDFFEFSRSVSINYVTLFLLAHGSQSVRSRVLDRLLGIDAVEKLARAITAKPILDEMRSLKGDVDFLRSAGFSEENLNILREEERRLEQELIEGERLLEGLKKEASDLEGAAKKYQELKSELNAKEKLLEDLRDRVKGVLSLDALVVGLEELRDKLLRAAEKLLPPSKLIKEIEGIEVSEYNLREVFSAFERVFHQLDEIYSEKYREIKGLSAQVEVYEKQLREIESRLVGLEEHVSDYERAESEIEKIKSEYGDENKLREEIGRLESELGMLQRRSELERCVSSVRRVLAEEVAKKGEAECYVCGNRLSEEFLDWVREKVSKSVKELKDVEESIGKLRERINVLKKKLEDLREYKLTLINYEAAYEEYQRLLEERKNLQAALDAEREELERAKSGLSVIGAELKVVREDFLRLRTSYSKLPLLDEIKKLEQEVSSLRSELQRLEPQYNKYLELEKRIEALSREIEDKRHRLEGIRKDIDEKRAMLESFEERLARERRLEEVLGKVRRVKEALIEVHADLRSQKIMELNKVVNEIVRGIYPYTDIEEVRVRVVSPSRRVGGRSIYQVEVKVGGEWYPYSSRLSDGQKTVVFLSLLIGLNRLLNKRVGFLVLDEPVPNVDDAIKASLLKSMLLVTGLRQAIVTTQAEDIAGRVEGVSLVRLSRM